MTSEETSRYREATLMIVDDDDIDAKGVERGLRKLKLLNPIRRARDGQEALDMMRGASGRDPWIVLLDLNMPRMTGLEFLEHMRQDPVLTTTVVFVLTTSKRDEDICAAYREHVAGYMVKQRAENDFLDIVAMIESYWRVVELPIPLKVT
jgi:CheY-like chemotaxis protein